MMRTRRTTFSLTFLLVLWTSSSCDDALSPGGGAVDGPPVTTSQAILTADRYARVHWTMTTANRQGITCEGTFLSNYPVGDRIGVGYKWGGWTDVDEFVEKVAQGYATGTGGGLTYETIPFDCVVGVSCTGLVSRAWHLNHKYTLNYPDPDIPRKFREITHTVPGVDISAGQVEGVRKGDVFINEYHTMLFVYETTNGIPMIIDSSYDGVRFRSVSWGELASEGYTAIRYNNILEDSDPPGTASNPIVLTPGPSETSVEGNTRDVVSLEFHRYALAPAFQQPGPEVVYEIVVGEPGTLTASITEFKTESINNDLHLLSSLDTDSTGVALDCIARDDDFIEAALEGGNWYLIVDGTNNAPGEYTLTVAFEPEPTTR
ncbi:MAG: hypothetical protein AMS21_08855 [Gemmatimonas sp. SG8_38_2]|nr:MAG: hypothetical protein AMS21_08855 [Gemmatimonas sp. SG8_38_2]